MALPLEGLRALDLTLAVAGPLVGRALAHLGAEVLKVEAPWGRGEGPDPFFQETNRGKRSISLNLQEPEGREVFLRLVAISDVVVENFSPRVLRNLGLPYEVLRRARPDLVLLSLPALGHQGPWADYIAFGPGIEALAGLSALTGYEGGPPLKAPLFYPDATGALQALVALLAALHRRRRTGEGAHIIVPLRECVQVLIGEAFLEAGMRGRDPPPRGNRHPSWAPHGVYQCRGEDAWLALACADDGEFRRLCRAIGRPDLADDPRFSSPLSRKRNEGALDTIIEGWTRQRTPQEAVEALRRAGVRAERVATPRDLLGDPLLQARGFWEQVRQEGGNETAHPGLPFRASLSGVKKGLPAPAFAEGNEWAQRELLALPDDIMEAIERKGVMPQEPVGE